MDWNKRFFLLLAFATALRVVYLFTAPLDLVADEAYYWDWSRQLDWGYFSKPPLIAWIIALSPERSDLHPRLCDCRRCFWERFRHWRCFCWQDGCMISYRFLGGRCRDGFSRRICDCLSYDHRCTARLLLDTGALFVLESPGKKDGGRRGMVGPYCGHWFRVTQQTGDGWFYCRNVCVPGGEP